MRERAFPIVERGKIGRKNPVSNTGHVDSEHDSFLDTVRGRESMITGRNNGQNRKAHQDRHVSSP